MTTESQPASEPVHTDGLRCKVCDEPIDADAGYGWLHRGTTNNGRHRHQAVPAKVRDEGAALDRLAELRAAIFERARMVDRPGLAFADVVTGFEAAVRADEHLRAIEREAAPTDGEISAALAGYVRGVAEAEREARSADREER